MKKRLWMAVLWAPVAAAAFEVQFTPEGPVSTSGDKAAASPAVESIEGAVTVAVADLRRVPEPVSAGSGEPTALSHRFEPRNPGLVWRAGSGVGTEKRVASH
jgi:hypothetical protein